MNKATNHGRLARELLLQGHQERGPVYRVNEAAVAESRLDLIALQLTHEMPVNALEISGLLSLGLCLLITVLTEVALA